MLKNLKKSLAFFLGLIVFAGTAIPGFAADGGAGMVWIRSPYKGHDDYYIPFPSLQLETKYFFIKELKLGFYLYRDDAEEHELTLGITPGFTVFDPDKTSDFKLSFLDKRKMAADVYLQYIRRFRYGTVGAKLYMDVLGNADGFGADVFYKLPVFINEFTITPGIGLSYLSGDRTDYYYGISTAEAVRSGLPYYHADFSISPYVSLEASYLTENGWNIFANAQYTFLSNEITDSPMIQDEHGLILSIGAMVNF
jgi:outer membrane protein